MTEPTSDLLRQMIRQVLLEVVPTALAGDTSNAEVVAIAGDGDLQAFARRIAALSDSERADIVLGRSTFRIAPRQGLSTATHATDSGVLRLDSGAVTERHVRTAAATGAAIVLGRKAVLTPLANDHARATGVEITREQ